MNIPWSFEKICYLVAAVLLGIGLAILLADEGKFILEVEDWLWGGVFAIALGHLAGHPH